MDGMQIITPSLSLTQASNESVDCNPCQIIIALTSLSQVYWYDATINLTMDTNPVVVIQYNNQQWPRLTISMAMSALSMQAQSPKYNL